MGILQPDPLRLGLQRHQAVSGHWHTHGTFARTTAASGPISPAGSHGICAAEAIHAALNGQPWLPIPVTG
jgi:hypothetical protein